MKGRQKEDVCAAGLLELWSLLPIPRQLRLEQPAPIQEHPLDWQAPCHDELWHGCLLVLTAEQHTHISAKLPPK